MIDNCYICNVELGNDEDTIRAFFIVGTNEDKATQELLVCRHCWLLCWEIVEAIRERNFTYGGMRPQLYLLKKFIIDNLRDGNYSILYLL